MSIAPPIQPQRVLPVTTREDLEATTARYVIQGYAVVIQSPTSVLLLKRKEFSIIWAIVGFFFCLLPLFIYVIYYMLQTDQVVQIELDSGPVAAPTGPLAPAGGSPGLDAPTDAPPQVISPDGKHYWDGRAWQPIEDESLDA